MTWEEYYDKFYEWSENTRINRISQITSFGPTSEILEVVDAFVNEKASTRLIQRAVDHNVQFSAVEITQLADYVNEECLDRLVKSSKCKFSEDQIDQHVEVL